jgi:hypothetical protein
MDRVVDPASCKLMPICPWVVRILIEAKALRQSTCRRRCGVSKIRIEKATPRKEKKDPFPLARVVSRETFSVFPVAVQQRLQAVY